MSAQCIVAGIMPMSSLLAPLRLACLLLCVAPALTGCGPRQATLDDAINRYDRGLFGTAQQMAEQQAARSTGDRKAAAAWVAGLSALRQRDELPAARRWLTATTLTSDPLLKARAEAMLGEVCRREGRTDAAIRHWDRAWPHLEGADRTETAGAAVELLTAAGDQAEAARWRSRLHGADEVPATGSWTLQAGAFRSRQSADTHRRTLHRTATSAGLGSPRVHETNRDGGSMWLVQLGAFESRGDAAAARRRLSGTELLIVRAP